MAAEISWTLTDYLTAQQLLLNANLNEWFEKNQSADKVIEAAKYSLFLPSKRIRPLFCLEACRALGGNQLDAMPAAMALEMIHTYSLVHDDLPSMDNDDLRRGRPTNHKVYGEARAILAGDGLLTAAFEALVTAPSNATFKTRSEWVRTLAQASGMQGMVLGQDWDIHVDGGQTLEKLQALHAKKTGALLSASVVMGALAARADESICKEFHEFGEAMGLAFQIRDDVLDVIGGEAIGKPVRSDERNDKTTYVTLLGLEGAQKEGQRWFDKALHTLGKLPLKNENRLEELTRFVIERKV